jgi:hypothetical protein
VATDASAGIVFWVVIRDKNTRKIISTQQFRTHDEAVHYHLSADDPNNVVDNGEVSIEILAPGKLPK